VNVHVASGSIAVSITLVVATTLAAQAPPAALPRETSHNARTSSRAQDRSGEPPERCHPADTVGLELEVAVLETGGAEALSLQQAGLEAAAIWSAAGIRVSWSVGHGAEFRLDRTHVPIVLRRLLRRPGETAGASEGNRPLGWVLLDPGGQPKGPIEVSLSSVSAKALSGVSLGRRLVDMPLANQHYIVGRALGRVVAHEIGHWLFGRAHTTSGLMAPQLDTGALTRSRPPELPREWMRSHGGQGDYHRLPVKDAPCVDTGERRPAAPAGAAAAIGVAFPGTMRGSVLSGPSATVPGS
jgi:hypothetical protein